MAEQREYARLFKAKLRRLGWNQVEAAEQLKISSNYVSMVARGRSRPGKSLLAFLDLHMKYRLLQVRQHRGLDKRIKMIVEKYDTLSPQQQAEVTRFFEAIFETIKRRREKVKSLSE